MLAISGMACLSSRSLAASGSPMSTIPVYGTVAAGTFSGPAGTNPISVTGGTFAGFFSVGNFVVQNSQLLAPGTLSGTLALVDTTGNAVPPQQASQNSVAVPLTIGAGASCQLLHLLFGPINISLLGLVIHPTLMTLDITPQSAPGNGLAAPLCNVATLLGSTKPSLSAVATQLQQVLQAMSSVSPLRNIALVGTTAAGGLIPGAFSIDNFAVDPNNPTQLDAVGSFSGIAPNASGQPTPATQPLTLPVTVDASSTCQLLILSIGSLSQNLLGTAAAINPVVLNITAQQAPSSLLCGIASQSGNSDLTTLAGTGQSGFEQLVIVVSYRYHRTSAGRPPLMG